MFRYIKFTSEPRKFNANLLQLHGLWCEYNEEGAVTGAESLQYPWFIT
jgi:hypothetical protein